MTVECGKEVLFGLGASEGDIEALLEYTDNVFRPVLEVSGINLETDEELSPNWFSMLERINETCTVAPRLEMFRSVAGLIPVVYPYDAADFEKLLCEIVYKNRDIPNLKNMGASFVFGKTLRFIILSDKPYSGVPAGEVGLSEQDWASKSLIIRKHHECAHYYTKRYFSSSRNNLHDELIADFCGIYAAFGEYSAELFIKSFNKRLELYTKDLSSSAAGVIFELAKAAATGVETWTKTPEFHEMNESDRIDYLAKKELLEYMKA